MNRGIGYTSGKRRASHSFEPFSLRKRACSSASLNGRNLRFALTSDSGERLRFALPDDPGERAGTWAMTPLLEVSAAMFNFLPQQSYRRMDVARVSTAPRFLCCGCEHSMRKSAPPHAHAACYTFLVHAGQFSTTRLLIQPCIHILFL